MSGLAVQQWLPLFECPLFEHVKLGTLCSDVSVVHVLSRWTCPFVLSLCALWRHGRPFRLAKSLTSVTMGIVDTGEPEEDRALRCVLRTQDRMHLASSLQNHHHRLVNRSPSLTQTSCLKRLVRQRDVHHRMEKIESRRRTMEPITAPAVAPLLTPLCAAAMGCELAVV